ncbi:hypothetical protein AB0K92_26535, partial [Streptomyces sp. NPDC052687]
MSPDLPPVAPSVTAELVEALSPRLRKRLDAGVAKLAARPVVREGDLVRIAVDDETDVVLHVSGGAVSSADAIRCACLLAPDCLHRAAAACAAPVAEHPPAAAHPPAAGHPPAAAHPPAAEPAEAGNEQRATGPESEAPPRTGQPAGAAGRTGHPEPESATEDQRAAAAAVHAATAAVLEAGTDGAGAVLQAELLR